VNIGALFQQARDLQNQLAEAQELLKDSTVTGESGAGLVKVTLNGRFEALRVEIDPSVAKDEVSVLEDLLAAAMNDAVRRVEQLQKEKMADLAERLGMPPGMQLPGGWPT